MNDNVIEDKFFSFTIIVAAVGLVIMFGLLIWGAINPGTHYSKATVTNTKEKVIYRDVRVSELRGGKILIYHDGVKTYISNDSNVKLER